MIIYQENDLVLIKLLKKGSMGGVKNVGNDNQPDYRFPHFLQQMIIPSSVQQTGRIELIGSVHNK